MYKIDESGARKVELLYKTNYKYPTCYIYL